MTDLLVTARLASTGGDLDEQENSWTFHSDVPGWPLAADFDDLKSLLDTFYAALNTDWWSPELSDGAFQQYDFYDITAHLNGSPHGSPVAVRSGAGIATTGDPLPGQIACAVDFHADLAGISEFGPGSRPRARRRGRHYHGPIRVGALTHDSSTFVPFWKATAVASMAAAYSALLAAVPSGVEWTVWSRKDAATHPVVGGWVDTTPHRARRREEPTNVKVLWS